MFAGWQVIPADAEPPPSLVEAAVAVLSYCVHSDAEVVAVTCTLNDPPAARSVGPQFSAWFGLVPEVEHSPGFDWVSIDQVTPVPDPAGSGSLTVTPVAFPAPMLVT